MWISKKKYDEALHAEYHKQRNYWSEINQNRVITRLQGDVTKLEKQVKKLEKYIKEGY
jgi:hypothetical protein